MLQPHYISDDGIDLLTKLLQFNPSSRITSSDALNHPYFVDNGIASPIITPAPVTSTPFFDLPIIPLSPFQIEEDYSQFNLLQRKTSIATSSVYNQPFADTNSLEHNPLPEDNCSTLTRTSSFPSLYNAHSELDSYHIYNQHHYRHCQERHHIEHGHTLHRSVSDLSIPLSNDLHRSVPQDQIQQQPQQEKQKAKLNPIHRFHFWAKKRTTT